jgi:hypothetical protein
MSKNGRRKYERVGLSIRKWIFYIKQIALAIKEYAFVRKNGEQ